MRVLSESLFWFLFHRAHYKKYTIRLLNTHYPFQQMIVLQYQTNIIRWIFNGFWFSSFFWTRKLIFVFYSYLLLDLNSFSEFLAFLLSKRSFFIFSLVRSLLVSRTDFTEELVVSPKFGSFSLGRFENCFW